ncbi:MAG: hypothetical protein ABH832_01870 [bacterium]
MKNTIRFLMAYALISVLIYCNLNWFKSNFFSVLLLAIFFVLTAKQYKVCLQFTFNTDQKGWLDMALACFVSFYITGFISAIFLVFWQFTNFSIALAISTSGLLAVAAQIHANTAKKKHPDESIYERATLIQKQEPKAKLAVIIYFILVGIAFYILMRSSTAQSITSPWQSISSSFFYIYFSATVILGFLIYSKLSRGFIIFLLIVHSLLLHSYLPLSHNMIFGADQWRHMAVEKQIVESNGLNYLSFDNKPQTIIQKLDPGRLGYANLWATESSISILSNRSLVSVNRWLVPLLFAIFFPLLLYMLARKLDLNEQSSLFCVWASSLFFPLQSLGSMTLPVSFGLGYWMIFLILLACRIKKPKPGQRWILLVLLALGFFGYSLYLILSVVAWIFAEIIINKKSVKFLPTNFVYYALTCLFIGLIIPLLEIIAGYGSIDSSKNIISAIKQFVGNISAFFLATGPRTHDIIGGNIIFNQVPSYSFIANVLTSNLWWISGVAIIIILLAFLGWLSWLVSKKKELLWFASISCGLWLAYFLSFYMLKGERVLSRRLDMALAIGLLFLFVAGISKYFLKQRPSIFKISIIVIGLSLAITASLSLGPDSHAISSDEYNTAGFIWDDSSSDLNHCVIANTYALLPLEYISAKNIVGGGFPINRYFAQPERVKLEEQFKSSYSGKLWQEAIDQTQAEKCYVVLENDLPNEIDIDLDLIKFGNIRVYRFDTLKNK